MQQEELNRVDVQVMLKAGKVAGSIVNSFRDFIKAGITTKDIELYFDKSLEAHPGMIAAFKGFSGYPASVCVSVNDEIIHGIPSEDRVLQEGDLVSVDLGIKYKGFFVDTAYTYSVGHITDQAKKLIKITQESLYQGITAAKVSNSVGDIGNSVQSFVEDNGFGVVRKFVGHGIGDKLHMPPQIPNFGNKGSGYILRERTAIAIEPMVTVGSYDVKIGQDGWTAKTYDGKLSAHFEHTVLITKSGPVIITQ